MKEKEISKLLKKTRRPEVERNEKGQLAPGSVLNPAGRPVGVFSFSGRTNKEKREFFLTKFYEKAEEHWDKLYDGLFRLVGEGDIRAILAALDHMIPKVREKDVEIDSKEMGGSVEELKQQLVQKILESDILNDQLKKVLAELEKHKKENNG